MPSCGDQTWAQFNSGIGINYLKKMELELRNFELRKLELKFPTKKLNPEINLPFLQH